MVTKWSVGPVEKLLARLYSLKQLNLHQVIFNIPIVKRQFFPIFLSYKHGQSMSLIMNKASTLG